MRKKKFVKGQKRKKQTKESSKMSVICPNEKVSKYVVKRFRKCQKKNKKKCNER